MNRSVKWAAQIFWYGDKLERGDPTKTYRPNDLEEEGETAQTKHEKFYFSADSESPLGWFILLAKTRDFCFRTKCIFAIALLFIQSIHRWQNINNWFSMASINSLADSSTFAESKQLLMMLHLSCAETLYNPICYARFL